MTLIFEDDWANYTDFKTNHGTYHFFAEERSFDRGINKDIWTFSHFGIYTFPSGKMGSDITILSQLEFHFIKNKPLPQALN